ncbi:hypothetical protein [Nocardia sp. NBC_01388]|uniref:hypothetical protein n=1 Tax=Nocardia sp. NBC_01388 TaxID=2903596 RepID=UPI00324C603B
MLGRQKLKPAPTIQAPSDPRPLELQLTDARQRLQLLQGDAGAVLADAPSEEELAGRRAVAVWRRAELLKAEQAELTDQLAAAEALRQANKAIRETDIQDVVDARKALAEQRRAESPASGVAELRRFSRRTRNGCAAIIAAGMLWSAINVQHNMGPGGVKDPMFWASFLIEGMISGLLILIALGTAKVRETAKREPGRGIRLTEAGLFLATLGLNTYPYVKQGHWYDTVLHGIAPAGIGAALLTLHFLGQEYTLARKDLAARITDLDTVQLPSLDAVHSTVHRATSHPGVQAEAMRPTAPGQLDDEFAQLVAAPVHALSAHQQPMGAHAHAHPEVEGAHAHSEVHIEGAHTPDPEAVPPVAHPSNPVQEEAGAHPEPVNAHPKLAHDAQGAHVAEGVPAALPVPDLVQAQEPPAEQAAVIGDAQGARSAQTGAHEVRATAAELVRRGVTTKTVEQVTTVLELSAAGVAPSTVARDTQIHYKTVVKILDNAEALRQPRLAANGGHVINLERRTQR